MYNYARQLAKLGAAGAARSYLELRETRGCLVQKRWGRWCVNWCVNRKFIHPLLPFFHSAGAAKQDPINSWPDALTPWHQPAHSFDNLPKVRIPVRAVLAKRFIRVCRESGATVPAVTNVRGQKTTGVSTSCSCSPFPVPVPRFLLLFLFLFLFLFDVLAGRAVIAAACCQYHGTGTIRANMHSQMMSLCQLALPAPLHHMLVCISTLGKVHVGSTLLAYLGG